MYNVRNGVCVCVCIYPIRPTDNDIGTTGIAELAPELRYLSQLNKLCLQR